jgi:putative RecB family exonuclease
MSFPLPSTLTPSKLTKFMSCPLAFRFSYIERLPEPPSPHLVRGTLVHRALQLLLGTGHASARTPERAHGALEEAWGELEFGEIASLALDEGGERAFRTEADSLLDRYLALEDPTSVQAIGIELDLRAEVDGIELHGIIDRLDLLPNGDLAVIDYKTGRAPRPERARARMIGVQFYALLCEQVLGRVPREVRLLYLRDPVVMTEAPSAQSMQGVRKRAVAVWQAISRACEREDFRPNPSALCGYCTFQQFCPAFGGVADQARSVLGAPVATKVSVAAD